MQPEFVQRLERACAMAGVPFVLTAAYRCRAYNAQSGGPPQSSHLKGLAVDIALGGGRMRFLIRQALMQSGFSRFGTGPDFIHVDADPDKPDRVEWIYP